MANCERIKKQKSKICLGDMDTMVNIYHRNLETPKNVKYGLNIENIRPNTWVMWQNQKETELFDEVNQSIGVATDLLYLHYDKDFRQFDYVELNNELYEIISSKILDTRSKEFIVLYCVLKGNKNKKVNIL